MDRSLIQNLVSNLIVARDMLVEEQLEYHREGYGESMCLESEECDGCEILDAAVSLARVIVQLDRLINATSTLQS